MRQQRRVDVLESLKLSERRLSEDWVVGCGVLGLVLLWTSGGTWWIGHFSLAVRELSPNAS
jgi:hypothetical protein